MSTQLFFGRISDATSTPAKWSSGNNDAKLNGSASGWANYEFKTTRGSGLSTQAVNTIDGPTDGLEITMGTPGLYITAPFDADVTISGSITFNMWAHESSMSANATIGCIIEKIDGATGAFTEIIRSIFGTELGTATAAKNWSAAPGAGVSCKKGDRLRVRPYVDDYSGGTMQAGYTAYFAMGAASADIEGDSYVTFTETFGFLTSNPTGSTLYPIDTLASGLIDPAAPSVSDSFNRANENPLMTGSWSRLDTGWGDMPQLLSQAVGAQSSSNSGAYWTGVGPVDDCLVYATISELPTKLDTDFVAVLARVSGMGGAGAFDAYMARYYRDTGAVYKVQLVSWSNASPTVLSSTTQTLSTGNKIALRCKGSAISVLLDTGSGWQTALSTTDTTYATGAAGFAMKGWDIPGSVPVGRLDDWGGIDLPTTQIVNPSRGSGVVEITTYTKLGWTAPVQMKVGTANRPTPIEWYTRPLEAFTLSGAVLVNARWKCTSVAAFRCEIAVCSGDGTLSSVWAAISYPDDIDATETQYQMFASGDDLSVTAGQRLRIRMYLDDTSLASMAGSSTATHFYAGSSGASGDTYLTFTQTITEAAVAASLPPSRPLRHPLIYR